MDPKTELKRLLSDLPGGGHFDVDRERVISRAVSITGELKGREGNGVVVRNGEVYFIIPEERVESITRTDSRPHVDSSIPEVTVQIARGTVIKAVHFVDVDRLGEHVGAKPLVYDIPSRAEEFAVEGEPIEKAHDEWMKNTGLSGFMHQDKPATFKTTYYPTYKQTSQQTARLTGTSNNDTVTDYSTDYVTDTFQDPSLDAD